MTGFPQTTRSLARMPGLAAELEPYREMLLANVVMVGEIPAPTFGEEDRISFIKQRFTECGLQSCSSDEVGNGMGIIPGAKGDKTILMSAHADTPFAASDNHTFTIEQGVIRGPGVADNSMGLAVLATLPTVLERLGIKLQSDLLLLAPTRSLEQGDQQGIRFFLSNSTIPLTTGIVVEGCPLGRLHYRSMASLGGMISCIVDQKVCSASAIEILNSVISQLGVIELCPQTNTALVLGSVWGGVTYKLPARTAHLRFQLRSDADDKVNAIHRQILSMLEEEAKKKGVSAYLEVIARTRSGGLNASHPLVTMTRKIMRSIGVQPKASIYSSTISPYLEHGIPAVCLGVSNGDNLNYADEYVEIEPMLAGLAQAIGLLLCIDGGDCA